MKEKIIEFLAPYIVTRISKYENIFGITEQTRIGLINGCSLLVTDKESCEFKDGKLVDYANADHTADIDEHCRYEHYRYNECDWEHISEYAILIIIDRDSNIISWLEMENFQIHKQ